MTDAEGAASGAAAAPDEAPRVLVVEDNAVNQLVICSMLATRDIDPTLADDGREGVEAYVAERPDLVFMDVSMPTMNGLDAARAIRERERAAGWPRCPIVALTANAMDKDRDDCLAAGMDDFLTKPVLMDSLSEALERWVGAASEALPATGTDG